MRKLKDGFIMRKIAGEVIVLPSGVQLDPNMMITLNETGMFLWERLQAGTTEEALLAAVMAEYEAEEETVRKYIKEFVEKLDANGFLA